jgi:hypothetical protein
MSFLLFHAGVHASSLGGAAEGAIAGLLVAQDTTVYASDDAGTTWTDLLAPGAMRAIAWNAEHEYAVALESGGDTLFKYAAEQWSVIREGVTNEAIDCWTQGSNIFLLSTGYTSYLDRSENGGATWTRVTLPLNAQYANNVVSWGSTVFVSSGWGLFRSTDNGDTWAMVLGEVEYYGDATADFKLATNGSGSWWAVGRIPGTNGNVWESVDDGETWRSLTDRGSYYTGWISIAVNNNLVSFSGEWEDQSYNTADTIRTRNLSTYAIDDRTLPTAVYFSKLAAWDGAHAAITNNNELVHSGDGITWSAITKPAVIGTLYSLAFAKPAPVSPLGGEAIASSNIWLALSSDDTALVSSDGTTFTEFECPFDIEAYFGRDSTTQKVYMSGYSGLYMTRNGQSWGQVAPPSGAYPDSMYALAADNRTLWFCEYSNLYKSTDGGATWITLALPADPYDNAIAARGDTIIYSTGSDVWRSTDGGVTWGTVIAGFDGYQIVPVGASEWWVVGMADGSNNSVWRSTNDGATFSSLLSDGSNIYAIAVGANEAIAAGEDPSFNTVFLRYDLSGGTWTTAPNTSGNICYSIAHDGANTYIAACDNQFRKSTDNGATWSTVSNPTPDSFQVIYFNS